MYKLELQEKKRKEKRRIIMKGDVLNVGYKKKRKCVKKGRLGKENVMVGNN